MLGKLAKELDEQITYALAQANSGRKIRWLTLPRIATAILDFTNKSFYQDMETHWITGGELGGRDDEKATTSVFVVMRDTWTKYAIKVVSANRETLPNEITTCGLISCKKETAREWANWVLVGAHEQV